MAERRSRVGLAIGWGSVVVDGLDHAGVIVGDIQGGLGGRLNELHVLACESRGLGVIASDKCRRPQRRGDRQDGRNPSRNQRRQPRQAANTIYRVHDTCTDPKRSNKRLHKRFHSPLETATPKILVHAHLAFRSISDRRFSIAWMRLRHSST
nr:MAG TPA_asm: hypothetical protein [Caudoviricetes sp.]